MPPWSATSRDQRRNTPFFIYVLIYKVAWFITYVFKSHTYCLVSKPYISNRMHRFPRPLIFGPFSICVAFIQHIYLQSDIIHEAMNFLSTDVFSKIKTLCDSNSQPKIYIVNLFSQICTSVCVWHTTWSSKIHIIGSQDINILTRRV